MGYRLSKLYTRTGDSGTTGLADGSRVSKDSARIEAMGTADELNRSLGVLLAGMTGSALQSLCETLAPVQHRLFDIGGERAIPGGNMIEEADVAELEQAIDRVNGELAPLKEFILPGGSPMVAQAALARSICRRAALPDPGSRGNLEPAGAGLSQPAVRPDVRGGPEHRPPGRHPGSAVEAQAQTYTLKALMICCSSTTSSAIRPLACSVRRAPS